MSLICLIKYIYKWFYNLLNTSMHIFIPEVTQNEATTSPVPVIRIGIRVWRKFIFDYYPSKCMTQITNDYMWCWWTIFQSDLFWMTLIFWRRDNGFFFTNPKLYFVPLTFLRNPELEYRVTCLLFIMGNRCVVQVIEFRYFMSRLKLWTAGVTHRWLLRRSFNAILLRMLWLCVHHKCKMCRLARRIRDVLM